MNKYTLRTVNSNNEIIAEDELILEANDILVLEMPENMSLEAAQRTHKRASEELQNHDLKVITLLNEVNLKVLKINN